MKKNILTYSLISSLLMLISGTPVHAAVTDPVVNVLDEVNHYVNVAGTVQEDLTTVASGYIREKTGALGDFNKALKAKKKAEKLAKKAEKAKKRAEKLSKIKENITDKYESFKKLGDKVSVAYKSTKEKLDEAKGYYNDGKQMLDDAKDMVDEGKNMLEEGKGYVSDAKDLASSAGDLAGSKISSVTGRQPFSSSDASAPVTVKPGVSVDNPDASYLVNGDDASGAGYSGEEVTLMSYTTPDSASAESDAEMTPLDANAEKAAAIADFATAAAVSPVTIPLNALPAVGSTTLTAEDILTQAQEKAEKEAAAAENTDEEKEDANLTPEEAAKQEKLAAMSKEELQEKLKALDEAKLAGYSDEFEYSREELIANLKAKDDAKKASLTNENAYTWEELQKNLKAKDEAKRAALNQRTATRKTFTRGAE